SGDAGSIRSEDEPMTEERLGGADRDVRASNTRHAFQILQAPVVRGRPQLRRVTAMSAQLHVKEIGDIDIQVRMKRLLPPGELRLLVRGDEIDKALFTAEVRAAGSEGGAERGLVVLVVRERGEQQDVGTYTLDRKFAVALDKGSEIAAGERFDPHVEVTVAVE